MMITSEVKICLVRIAALRRHGGASSLFVAFYASGRKR